MQASFTRPANATALVAGRMTAAPLRAVQFSSRAVSSQIARLQRFNVVAQSVEGKEVGVE
jgi:hypothetical protein